jgi:hypothetical protein
MLADSRQSETAIASQLKGKKSFDVIKSEKRKSIQVGIFMSRT